MSTSHASVIAIGPSPPGPLSSSVSGPGSSNVLSGTAAGSVSAHSVPIASSIDVLPTLSTSLVSIPSSIPVSSAISGTSLIVSTPAPTATAAKSIVSGPSDVSLPQLSAVSSSAVISQYKTSQAAHTSASLLTLHSSVGVVASSASAVISHSGHPSITPASLASSSSAISLHTSAGFANVPKPSLGDAQLVSNVSSSHPSPSSPATSHDVSPTESSSPSSSEVSSSAQASGPIISPAKPSLPALEPTSSLTVSASEPTSSVASSSAIVSLSSTPSPVSRPNSSSPSSTPKALSGGTDDISTAVSSSQDLSPPASSAGISSAPSSGGNLQPSIGALSAAPSGDGHSQLSVGALSAATSPTVPSPHESAPSAPNGHSSQLTAPNVAANADSITGISTTTDRPETTLSSPVFLTVTDARGHTSLSEPPVFTSVGISSISGGGFVSVTHIIANPTGVWDVNAASKKGFFANSGAVAGVFLVVGMVIASILVGGLFYMRRRRRQRRFVGGVISRPLSYPDNPFEDPRDPPTPGYPAMRYVSDSPHGNIVSRNSSLGQQNLLDDDDDQLPTPARPTHDVFADEPMVVLGMTGVGARGHRQSSSLRENVVMNEYESGQNEHRLNAQGTSGTEMTSAEAQERSRSRGASSVHSSPSMYPPSLPPVHSEEQLPTPQSELAPHEPLEIFAPQPVVSAMAPAVSAAARKSPPVIPPRSPLRARSPLLIQTEFSQKETGLIAPMPYEPLTPPGSTSSHSASASASERGSWIVNPFLDRPVEVAVPEEAKRRDTFYTRRKAVQPRPSTIVEWK